MCFSECPAFITLIVSLVTSPAPDDQIWMCFERWVQRTLKHKSLGNETPSVLDKKPPSHHVIFCFLRSLIDSERRLMARHLGSSNAALMEDKRCTNPFQRPMKTKQFVFLLSTFINILSFSWQRSSGWNKEMNKLTECISDGKKRKKQTVRMVRSAKNMPEQWIILSLQFSFLFLP